MKKGQTKTIDKDKEKERLQTKERQQKNIIKYMNRKIMDKQSLNGQYIYEPISKYMYIYEHLSIFSNSERNAN